MWTVHMENSRAETCTVGLQRLSIVRTEGCVCGLREMSHLMSFTKGNISV